MDHPERNCTSALVGRQYGYFTKWKDYDPIFYRYRGKLPAAQFPVYDTPVFACKTAQKEGKEHFVGMANEDGHVVMMNTENEDKACKNAHNNAIFDLAWKFDQMQLVTASGDHTSKLFDLEDGDFREVRMFCGHNRSVRTVAFRKDDSSVFVSGSRDGNIILWDIRCSQNSYIGKPDCTIQNSHVSKDFNTPSKSKKKGRQASANSGVKSVTGLVFQNSDTLISCGAGDGVIKLWDLRKHYTFHKREPLPKHVIPFSGVSGKNGYSCLSIDRSGVRVYANCLDNTIYCYNVSTYDTQPVMKYTGHQNDSFYIKSSLNHDENYLVSGSSDENAYLWNLNYSEPIVRLTGHNSEVTCVAWCKSQLLPTLITCSDDISFKIWTHTNAVDSPSDSRSKVEILPLPAQKPSRKRIYTATNFDFAPKRPVWQCNNCQRATLSDSLCENCVPVGLKRRADCDLWSDSKRVGTDFGPRRLFAHLNGNFKEGDPDQFVTVLERPEDEMLNMKSLNKALESYKSPSTSSLLASPTVNLPNFVVDGTAPHLNYSPPKRKSQDWLTKMRVERNIRQEMMERTMGPSSPKSPRLDLTPRSSRKSTAEPKSPLLRYFKVTNSSSKSDVGLGCTPKSHNCGYTSSGGGSGFTSQQERM